MEDTGVERLTNNFCFKPHAMPAPTMTSTNRIIADIGVLADAIDGVQ
jgi:hypothetical protein